MRFSASKLTRTSCLDSLPSLGGRLSSNPVPASPILPRKIFSPSAATTVGATRVPHSAFFRLNHPPHVDVHRRFVHTHQRFIPTKTSPTIMAGVLIPLGLGAFGAGYLISGNVGMVHASPTVEQITEDDHFIIESSAAKKPKKKIKKKAGVKKIVLTGGPCGGKSTALSVLSQRLQSYGFKVFLVPEAATLLFTGGGKFSEWDLEKEIAFEENKIRAQIALENAFMNLAEAAGGKAVVICDRGTMDSKAYISDETWGILMDKTGWSAVSLRDKQYDAVLHLVTTAIGAVEFYTTENNPSRSETPEEARQLDLKILTAWIGHPRLFIVDNSTDFGGKINKVVDIICRQHGIATQLPGANYARKFVLDHSPDDLPVKSETFDSEQTFLLRGGGKDPKKEGYVFIQKRGHGGVWTYRYSTKYQFSSGKYAYVERQISGMEYATLMEQADPSRPVVKKKITCFTYDNQYYEIETFKHPHPGLKVLKTDVTSGDLPPFVEAKTDVTANPLWSTYNLATVKPEDLEDLLSL